MTEIRSTATDLQAVTRDDAGKTTKQIQGYAIIFDTLSIDLGGFFEEIDSTALDGVDLSDIKLIYAHENNQILARTDAGNLQVKVDDKGVFFIADLADTTLANDVYNNIQAGNLKGMSFGFTIADGGDKWVRQPNGKLLHEVTQIGILGELTVTAWPAYPSTSVELKRSAEQQMKGITADMATETPTPTTETPMADGVLKQILDRLTALEQSEADEVAEDEAEDQAEPAVPAQRDDVPDETPADVPVDDTPLERDSLTHNQGDQNMAQVVTPPTATTNERSNLFAFLKRDFPSIVGGTVATDNSVVLPKDILTPIEKPANTNSLIALANVQPVSAPSGDIPVMGATDVTLATVEELQLNPQLAKLQLETVAYKLAVRRGFLPISQELLDHADTVVGIEKLIGDYASQIRDNTLVAEIAGLLKQANKSTATSYDDVKKAYNALFKYNNKSFVVTKSAYDTLDTLKDKNGRYLLQDSISSASGKQLSNSPVYVVEDTVLGTKEGDQVMFVGDVHSYAFIPTYKDLRVKWTDSDIYGQKLQLVLESDAVVTNKDAGSLVTLTFPVPTPPAG